MAQQYTLKNGGYEPFIGNYGLVPQPPIPEPESTDNGKVLGVAEGAYALVSGGGGGSAEPLIVNSTETGIDVSYNEVKTALLAGKTIYLLMVNGEDVFYSQLANIRIEGGEYYAAFYNGYNVATYTANDADTDMSSFNPSDT